MTSTNISIGFSPQIPLPQEPLRAFADADAIKKEVAAAILPPKTPASMEDIVLLDTLRRAKASLQASPFALDSKHAAPVRDNLKMLVALAEKKLTGVEPAPASAEAIEAASAEPMPSLQRADSGSLAAIGDRLAAAGQHKQAIMLYMAADMNQADQTDVRYVVQAGKSLLALGQPEQAEEAFLLAQNQNIKNGGDVAMPDSHAQIDQLLTTARAAIVNSNSAPDTPRRNDAATQKTAGSSFFNDMSDQDIDIDFLLSELGKLQHDTSQLRIESEQDAIKSNRDIRDQQITQKLEAILARNKAKAEREAAAAKMNFWNKLSKGLGMAAMLIGLALAPFTGGLSLLGTAYMALDFGLELGEHFSGVKMSIQSGLQIACEKIIEFCASGSGTAEDRQFWAGILGIVVNVIAMIAVTVVSAGAGASKLLKIPNILKKAPSEILKDKKVFAVVLKSQEALGAEKSIEKATESGLKEAGATGKKVVSKFERNLQRKLTLLRVARGAQFGGMVAGGGTAVYGGVCAYETAEAGLELNSADVQQAEIEKRQIRLDKLFEQCSDDLKLVAKEWQRDIELLAEILSGNIENRGKAINALFHRPHLAA
jgi:tetratricopeptide (TPR) repeat protein